MKRQLTTEEKATSNKMLLERIKEEEWLKYQIKYTNLMLEEGLKVNYEKQLNELKIRKKEFESQLKMINNIINTLKLQIRNGVEVKEKKEDKKEDKKNK